MNTNESTDNHVLLCSLQPTVPCLIDKGLDTIANANNSDGVIIISYGLALAFIFWGLGKAIGEVVGKIKQ